MVTRRISSEIAVALGGMCAAAELWGRRSDRYSELRGFTGTT